MQRKKAEIHFRSCGSSGNIYWILGAVRMQMQAERHVAVRTPGDFATFRALDGRGVGASCPKDKDLLIFCRSGKRSMAVSNLLIQNGYERVFNVVGGFMAFPKN